jgi:hypothetical protein
MLGCQFGGAFAAGFGWPAIIAAFILAGIVGALGGTGIGEWLGGLAGDGIRAATNWLSDMFGSFFFRRDPLVFDLDGNGVQLTSLTGSSVFFDLNGDGFAERTGWVSANDGLLALDVNGNGTIDNGGELFGTSTQTGFAILGTYDGNSDGVINSADAVYTNLRMWRDANSDGVSQASELVSAASAGILSVSLNAQPNGWATNAGNSILANGGYTTTTGTTREVIAVAFTTDQVNTRYVLPDGFASNDNELQFIVAA